jgi:hypothetical protein
MTYKIQYETPEDMERIIEENSDKFLTEVHNLLDGNFLVFSDTAPKPVEPQIVYTQVPLLEFQEMQKKLAELTK